jgi:hypothetical protein
MKQKSGHTIREKAIAIGILGGVVLGVVLKNIGLWLPLGIAIGAGVAFYNTKKEN